MVRLIRPTRKKVAHISMVGLGGIWVASFRKPLTFTVRLWAPAFVLIFQTWIMEHQATRGNALRAHILLKHVADLFGVSRTGIQ
jgi:hypothetical protein